MKETINKIKKKNYLLHISSIKHSFSLPLIFSYLDINIDETNSTTINIFFLVYSY